jgi:hypothetical protein
MSGPIGALGARLRASTLHFMARMLGLGPVRMRVREQRRKLLLSGERTSWRLSVAEEVDRWIHEQLAA